MKLLTVTLFGLLVMARLQIGDLPVSVRATLVDHDIVAQRNVTELLGAIIRGDQSAKKIALVFTGDEFGDGLSTVIHTLKAETMHASFFLTGNFYRNADFKKHIVELRDLGNYL